MPPVVIPGVHVAYITGPMVLGYMWGYCLYGMVIIQVYIYSQVFPKDRIGIKAVVWSMFTMETVFTTLCTIAAWNAYGPGWGDTDTLERLDWSWGPLPALNGILASMAQSFYIWRIWSLTKSVWLPILIGCVMLTQLTMSLYYDIVVAIRGRATSVLFGLSTEVTVWLVGSAVCDVLITASLVYILTRQKQRTMFPKTAGLVDKLIRFSVETGAITSGGALIELILWLTCNQWNFHFIFFLLLGRMYSNMLMATLNARAPIFKLGEGSSTTSIMPNSAFWADTVRPSQLGSGTAGSRGVHIARKTDITRDQETVIMDDFDLTDNTDGHSVDALRGKPRLVV